MGADIYLDSIHNHLRETYKPLLDTATARKRAAETDEDREKARGDANEALNLMYSDGYFRDSYNSSSVFWQMNISWWKDVGDMINDEGYLPIEQAKELRDLILSREIPETLGEEFKESEASEWIEHFKKKREEFLNLLNLSIDLEEPLCCSI